MNEEWCREQLKNLQIRDLRTNTLTEIKNQLISHPNDQLHSTNFIQSQELLDCLKDTTKYIYFIKTSYLSSFNNYEFPFLVNKLHWLVTSFRFACRI